MIDIVDVVQNIDVTFASDTEIQPINVIFKEDQSGIVLDFDQYSGFTNNYESLKNKPSIDGVTIVGDMTSADLGLVKSYDDLTDKPSVNGVALIGNKTSSDLGLVESYDDLTDRPSINGITLTGNTTSADLGLVESYNELQDKPSLDGVTIEGDMVYTDFGLVKLYSELGNKPTLNGKTIEGNGTSESYGIVLSDTFEHWAAKTNLVSQAGVIYVYTDYQAYDSGTGTTVSYPGVKIGNGRTKLNALPFINAPDPRLLNHIANTSIHVTSQDRQNWNGAVSDISVIQRQLTGSMHNIGETTTEISDGSTTIPIMVDGNYVVPSAGDVVRYLDREFMYADNGTWVEFGAVGNQVLRDTKEHWDAQPSLISEKDVIYIYTNYKTIDNGDGTYTIYPGMKIGDGSAYLIDIPFIGEGDGSIVTPEDIARWNNKWRGYMNENNPENLIFTVN